MGFLLFLLFLFVSSTGVLQQRAEVVGAEPAVEVATGLRVLNVYGERSDATSDLKTVRVLVELSAGSLPHDLGRLVLRYAAYGESATYARGADASSMPFELAWIRGDGRADVMEAGDLVQISFDLPRPLATRTDVQLTLIPEVGAPASADLRTPATYGTDTVITLR